ncbi:hypothetical protein EVAR_79921_1 [Eumeta japonica]|uniref:Uncharacterized protein n=1 Tax=Eumeta variegata TaxID=151549 RepID=A0A4C1TZ36_EUMVA|nr:hypothetical protein EVAR_79921_1 [Eumeta japonica]
MVKFGKNKFKILKKIIKKQSKTAEVSNKILKKKINAEKKVSFQKEVLVKEAVKDSNLVKNISREELILSELAKPKKVSKRKVQQIAKSNKPILKPVEKQKKRQINLVNDTKLLLNLMKKKKDS